MARTIGDEEHQLKRRARRRLIGAIVLVTAIVVVLPMVLDSEPKQIGQEVSVRIPSPDSSVFTSKVAPLPEKPAAKPGAKAPVESKSTAPAAEEQTAAPVAPAAAPQSLAQVETPKPAARKAAPKSGARKAPTKRAAKPAGGEFVVQVIALADAEKAKQMQVRIAAAGITSYTEVVKTAKGDVTRVRAGPFATREAAEKAREQLKTIGMSGNITAR